MQNNKDNVLKGRHLEIFKMIVEMYFETGEPVGSKKLVELRNLKISSATIRNIMSDLEKIDFLEKPHISGGRIPSTKGLEYYTLNIAYDPQKFWNKKLEDLLAKRRLSIDTTLDEAANLIGKMAHFTVVASSNNQDEKLRSIQLIPLNDLSAVIVIVTSSGNVQNKIFNFEKDIELNDLRIAIRLLKERLIDTPLIELASKTQALLPLFKERISNYELIIQKFIKTIFTFEEKIENKTYNKNAIILSKNISRDEIVKVLDFIEHQSVWETIENNIDEDNNIKLDYSRPNLNIISKKINFENDKNIKEISIVGPKYIDIEEGLEAITVLEKLVEKGCK
ncbi:heat-inducible transcriptional repressor HrcA [Mycoplasma enhydrae]|uniref:heat-inducible transcriptional repressor HrcA n=1 Tax=Mycoplasma enhydrae TaxID=2499220 RepID=UPI00197B81B5|nr:heat-inducible transcriptional repressor HrcA [Mycoplasma enhydrae]MBN4089638.1 heat-inducible transcriptional repressor HrcA [Mycoplasma enhydrae]MCV3733768.1 heat-inducible transcriptional repressor HrcA [Mycoplasma enhydrae]MCV3753523.1 heat-inducible transcriptional repressor HrcA [Mycoplasma enhydrae]